uniref:uncharacterized protein isoform X2 n=1 Tax=Myxine glutinosa TaxID=7769 RepID=UPI00358F28B6
MTSNRSIRTSSRMATDCRRDFPRWLNSRGVSTEVARALDTELGIRDHGALSACAADLQVRAELFAEARRRLPFGFYAVLRRIVVSAAPQGQGLFLQPSVNDGHPDAGGLSSLLHVLVVLLDGLSRELARSARKLSSLEERRWDESGDGTGSGGNSGAGDNRSPDCHETLHESGFEAEMAMEEAMSGYYEKALEDLPAEDGCYTEDVDEAETPHSQNDVVHIKRENLYDNQNMLEPAEEVEVSQDNDGGFSLNTEWTGVKPEPGPEAHGSNHGASLSGDGLSEGVPVSLASCTPTATDAGDTETLPDDTLALSAGEGDWLRLGDGGLSTHGVPDISGEATLEMGSYRTDDMGERTHRCGDCGESFPFLSQLGRHQLAHSEAKPHRCPECGQCFRQKHHLRVHLRKHTGEKPYPCDVCGKRFVQSAHLVTHRRVHTGERPYVCLTCGRGFAQSSHLALHRRKHVIAEGLLVLGSSGASGMGAALRQMHHVPTPTPHSPPIPQNLPDVAFVPPMLPR